MACIGEHLLCREAKRLYRLTHSKPKVEAFFDWVNRQFEQLGLLPSNQLTRALAYARERRLGLEVFLTDLDVPVDTNHLERALRANPWAERPGCFAGRKSGPSALVSCKA